MNKNLRILIYEPDAAPGQALMAGPYPAGYQSFWCRRVAEANELLDASGVDIAILSLSDGNGLQLLERMRRTHRHVPVLVATLADDVETRVNGLNRGAVDYLIRPFSVSELVARVATVSLRSGGTIQESAIQRGKLVLDKETGRIGDGKRWTLLTPREKEAFSVLFEHANQPVSKSRIKSVIPDGEQMTDNAIEVIIYRLRPKAHAWGMRIRSSRGRGYMLECVRPACGDPMDGLTLLAA